jgi:hypothetical protein
LRSARISALLQCSLRSPWRPIISKRLIGLSPFFLKINLQFAI